MTVPNLGKCLVEVVAEVIKIIGEERWVSMIDEKKLIEDIEYYILHTREESGEHYAYKRAKQLIERQPKVGEWIPCSKKMPDGCSDAEIEVIVSTHEPYSETVIDDSGFALYYPGTNKFHSVYGDRLDITEYVVAWQPLPTPYKEKRGGKND